MHQPVAVFFAFGKMTSPQQPAALLCYSGTWPWDPSLAGQPAVTAAAAGPQRDPGCHQEQICLAALNTIYEHGTQDA